MMNAMFGPAGNAESFKQKGYKNNKDIPAYLKEFNLDAYEYQCGHGVKISTQAANEFGAVCKSGGIVLSLHAPYFISLSSLEEEKRNNSINYIVDSALAADAMGAGRIIIHSGSCSKISRIDALELAKDTLTKAQNKLDELNLSHITMCPETMGKINQLGTLEEVLELCKIDERIIPCIDFGHLNARTFGGIKNSDDYKAIIEKIEKEIGTDRAKIFHSHFSKIEYTNNGGEKKHLTFSDTQYGPDFEPLAEVIAKKGLTPTFICESAGTQAEDAMQMKEMYFQKRGEGNG